jgi:hypothetical protein|tara:strand:+ start:9802 stop:10260 length:459 start_codon:yes stop_codon:yes gene_type:complete
MGFEWRYNLSGGKFTRAEFLMKDTETLTLGDMINIESGEADLAVTSDTGLAGTFLGPESPNDAVDGKPGTVSGTDSTTVIWAIINPDAVYSDAGDTNARLPGATLDISGATGAQGLAASSNTEFVVVQRKREASAPTFVQICSSAHYLAKAQ